MRIARMLLLAGLALPAAAQSHLVVILKDGRQQSFPLAEVARVEFAGGVVAPPPPTPSAADPTGTWRHHPEATWTITRTGDGRFHAQENGLGHASGPGRFTSDGTFRIDYVTRDGAISGYYEVRFSPDGRTAAGSVRELTGPRRTGESHWTRVASAQVDPTGVWRHHPEATWTISRSSDGRYLAQENGLGLASGEGRFTPTGTFRIDYTTRDGSIRGYYEVRFSPDGRTASGEVRELTGPRRTGPSSWKRER